MFVLCSCKTKTEQEVNNLDIYDSSVFDNLPKTEANINPILYLAESENGGKVYILGSIHCADESSYQLPSYIMDAYKNSDALAVEIDIVSYRNDKEAQQKDEEIITYKNNDNLSKHIDPVIYSGIVEFIKNNSEDITVLESLKNKKPCAWLSELSNIECEKAGLSNEFGIDDYFLNLAHNDNKEIVEIESSSSQYEALNKISDIAYEILFSEYAFADDDNIDESLRLTYEEWKKGEIQSTSDIDDAIVYEDLSEEDKAIIDYINILYIDRNVIMANKIKSFLNEGKNVFCTVGTEHLLGNKGIIETLKKEGYVVSKVK